MFFLQYKFSDLLKRWRSEEDGLALMEFVLIFPIMMTILFGVYDLGNGFIANQKTIAASQIISDLITRNVSITEDELDDIITAGQLTILPYDLDNMGYDIISVSFDSDDAPVEEWRRTVNMAENDTAFDSTTALGVEGDGVVVVSIMYNYEPVFGGFVIDNIPMMEVAFARGRRTPVVSLIED
jgi:Flp pilus assembly protein TadG